MTSKFWNILVVMYYISCLILLLPFFGLYILFANVYRKGRNKRKVKRILRRGGLPKELRKGVSQSYKSMLKSFSIRSVMKSQGLTGTSEEEKEKFGFVKTFKSFTVKAG